MSPSKVPFVELPRCCNYVEWWDRGSVEFPSSATSEQVHSKETKDRIAFRNLFRSPVLCIAGTATKVVGKTTSEDFREFIKERARIDAGPQYRWFL